MSDPAIAGGHPLDSAHPLGRAFPNDDVMLSEAKHLWCICVGKGRSEVNPRFFASLRMTFTRRFPATSRRDLCLNVEGICIH